MEATEELPGRVPRRPVRRRPCWGATASARGSAPAGSGRSTRRVDERLDRDVAVKVIPDRAAPAPERASREALAAARLDHPGIVAVFDAGEDGEARYLVSELVRGRTLDALAADGELSDRDVLRVGLALADALEHAHGRGVIHRDVKPQNVIVPDRPRSARSAAKLTDFGVAHLAGDEPLTRTGDVVGTLAYMAPEQADGQRVDERADLYSLALVLYEGARGRRTRCGPAARPRPRAGSGRCSRRCAASARTCRRSCAPRSTARCSPRPEDRGDARRARRRARRGPDRRLRRGRHDPRPPARAPAHRRSCRPWRAGSPPRWPAAASRRRPSRSCPATPVDAARRGGRGRGRRSPRCRAPAGWRCAAALAVLLAPDRPGAALVRARRRRGRRGARARLRPRLVAARRRAAARPGGARRRLPGLAGRAAALVAARGPRRRRAVVAAAGRAAARHDAARRAPTPPRGWEADAGRGARRRAVAAAGLRAGRCSPRCGRWRRSCCPGSCAGATPGVDFVAASAWAAGLGAGHRRAGRVGGRRRRRAAWSPGRSRRARSPWLLPRLLPRDIVDAPR